MSSSDNGQPPEPTEYGDAPESEKVIFKPDDNDIRREFVAEYAEMYAYLWGQWRNYQAEGGIWTEAERKIRREMVSFMASGRFQKLSINTSRVESALKLLSNYLPETDEMPEHPYLIPLKNGVFDVRTQTFSEHSPAYYFIKNLPYDYEPEAACPIWLKTLSEVLVTKDGEPDWLTMNFLQEAAGYALYGDNRLQAAIMLWGDGGSAKSLTLEVVRKLTGSSTSVDLQTLSLNELAMTIGERMVTFNELDKGAYIPEATFKRALSSDLITAKLLYKDVFTFQPSFMLWGATNHLPRVKDRSRAVFRRMQVIRFPIVVQNPDVYLIEKITKELPGIFIWAMDGLKRLLARGHFEPSPAVQQANFDWRYYQDVERQFLDSEVCIAGTDKMAQAKPFYDAYRQWCADNGYKPKTSTNVADDWKRLGLYKKKTNGGLHFWCGVGLQADDIPIPEGPAPRPRNVAYTPPKQKELIT